MPPRFGGNPSYTLFTVTAVIGGRQRTSCLERLAIASGVFVVGLNTLSWGWSVIYCLTTELTPGTTPWGTIWFCLLMPIAGGAAMYVFRAVRSNDSYYDLFADSLVTASVLALPCLLLAAFFYVV